MFICQWYGLFPSPKNEGHSWVFVLKNPKLPYAFSGSPTPLLSLLWLTCSGFSPIDCRRIQGLGSRPGGQVRHFMIQAVSPAHALLLKSASLRCQWATFSPHFQVHQKLIWSPQHPGHFTAGSQTTDDQRTSQFSVEAIFTSEHFLFSQVIESYKSNMWEPLQLMVGSEPQGLWELRNCCLLWHIKPCSLDKDRGGRAVSWVETVS